MSAKIAANKYRDPLRNKWATKLLPGEFCVGKGEDLLVTTLGSCIAACIRDKKLGIGGMNHFMLPSSDTGDWGHAATSTRYGNFAMEYLINEILKQGGERANLEVAIFGGSKMFEAGTVQVGADNIAFVKDYLRTEGLRLIQEDLGGDQPRKVYFEPGTGEVQVKKLEKLKNNTLQERESSYKHELDDKPVEGDVELF